MSTTGTLLITRGLPASGKTHWARRMVNGAAPTERIVRLNRDDLRAMMLKDSYRQPEPPAEVAVSVVQRGPIVELLQHGIDVIIDDTNLRARHVKDLARLAVHAGAQWRCVDHFLDVDVATCIMRDKLRARPVGEEVILGMHRKYLQGGRRLSVPDLGATAVVGKPYVPDPSKPHAVLVDIDGTVALNVTRGPYDTSRYHEDAPNWPVIEAVRQEADCVQAVVFCSGRSEEFREVTEAWIDRHVLARGYGWELFMRPSGDTRNDAIVKLELFDDWIRDRYNIRRVYDDRRRVIDAWRSIGLTVFAVADGNF